MINCVIKILCILSRVYLLKILCRRYGIHIYQRLSKSHAHSLNWVAFEGRSEQVFCLMLCMTKIAFMYTCAMLCSGRLHL